MKRLYKAVRILLVTVFALGLVLPALLYLFLTFTPATEFIRKSAESELSELLDVDVKIGSVDFSPFNRVALGDVLITSREDGDTIASIADLGAGINLTQLLLNGRVVVTYAEILELDGRIYRATPESPLNIQPIIDALSPRDKSKPPTLFDFKVNTVVIRRSRLRYDVGSAPEPLPGRFDPSHVAIDNLRADIVLPRIANDDFTIDIIDLACSERSGLSVKSLSGQYHLTATSLTATSPRLEFNRSTLLLSDIELTYDSFATIGDALRSRPISLDILPGTRIVPADLRPVLPLPADFDYPVDITATFNGTLDRAVKAEVALSTADNSLTLNLQAMASSIADPSQLALKADLISLHCGGSRLASVVGSFTTLPPAASRILDNAGTIELNGSGSWDQAATTFDGDIATDLGRLDLTATMLTPPGANRSVEGHFRAANINLGLIADNPQLGLLTMDADVDATFGSRLLAGRFNGTVDAIDLRGYTYHNITANVDYDGALCSGTVAVNDPAVELNVDGQINLDGDLPQLDLKASGYGIDLAATELYTRYPGRRLSFEAEATLAGRSINDAVGSLNVAFIDFTAADGSGILFNDISLDIDNASSPQRIDLRSEPLDLHLEGEYTLTALPARFKHIAATIFPALLPAEAHTTAADPASASDHFDLGIILKPDARVQHMLHLPIEVVDTVRIDGSYDAPTGAIALNVMAPYLLKGNTLLQNTSLALSSLAGSDMVTPRADLTFTTAAHMKNDVVTLALSADAYDNMLTTSIAWDYNRPKRYDGRIDLATIFSRTEPSATAPYGDLRAAVHINPSTFVVNDTTWHVDPGLVTLTLDHAAPRAPMVDIDNITVHRAGQSINASGQISSDPSSVLRLLLSDVNLDYIFEALHLDNVMLGGDASGTIVAADILSGAPRMSTDDLVVRSIKYNHCTLGDAFIRSSWDNENRAIRLSARVEQPNGRESLINGAIMPLTEGLDISFDCDHVNIAFMQTFMSAFAESVEGEASGHARLFGTFKDLDLEGDIFADDLRLKLDFTDVTYSASDSVKILPGKIIISDIEMRDPYGNTATLNGVVNHTYFRFPTFDFKVNNAHNFLVYDVAGDPLHDRWYGRIFGDGEASVSGEPGIVNIDINMRTAPKSTFTFVLSDSQVASEYKFLTFRDRDRAIKDSISTVADTRPQAVKQWEQRRQTDEDSSSSAYAMDFRVDVTPDAEVILVMDPIGGDRIRAFGEGNLHMYYNSGTEDLEMFGLYTLDRGTYNFTLQDIILREFSILEGSTIEFSKDPYHAILDINADYVLNANLSDLDESFLQDKDLNRTNVPVHARAHIAGDMNQPAIGFSLVFPTLNSDIDRKVQSILSTEDMISRQVVYLLTLNRFYTPDYMTTTRGNEFVSMASSTLSSQLSNALGHLSDNWSIAPNLRSDRGDFSDVEFDLGLSSTLLNNRLRFNGNFGYRDKALNSNSFIGDFDIEYLLNRSGSIRLKAYNRYNDQNYYLRSALTTQGVGVVFRNDFDNFFHFVGSIFRRPKRKASETPDSIPAPQEPQEP